MTALPVLVACVVAAASIAVRYVRWRRASQRRHDALMAVAEAAQEVPPAELAALIAQDAIFDALVEAARIESAAIWLELDTYATEER